LDHHRGGQGIHRGVTLNSTVASSPLFSVLSEPIAQGPPPM
jgi:hypothetical protein